MAWLFSWHLAAWRPGGVWRSGSGYPMMAYVGINQQPVASANGGRVDPAGCVFNWARRWLASIQLWPGLLALLCVAGSWRILYDKFSILFFDALMMILSVP